LLAAGLDLTGIAMVLDLEQNAELRAERRSGMDRDAQRVIAAGNDLAADIPEADLLEQREDLVPQAESGLPAAPTTRVVEGGADEADLIEQATPVFGDEDEDFPHGLSD
jgi:hypothetical protein